MTVPTGAVARGPHGEYLDGQGHVIPPVVSDFDVYQQDAVSRMARDLPDQIELATLALGVAGEAGEVADHIKKVIGHGHPIDREKLMLEIGDVLWYVAVLSNKLGFSLSTIAEANTEKLRARYGDRFSTEASMNRG